MGFGKSSNKLDQEQLAIRYEIIEVLYGSLKKTEF